MTDRVWKLSSVSIAVLAMWCALAIAAPEDRKGIVFRGRLADPESFPIEKVQVVVEGSRSASTLSDQDGRWSLTVPLGTRSELAHTPLSLTLRVRDGSRSYSLANGRSELRVELRSEGVSDGSPLLAVRATDAQVAEAIARALRAEGDTNAVVPVMFVGRPRGPATPDTFATALPAYEPVLLTAGNEAATDSATQTPVPHGESTTSSPSLPSAPTIALTAPASGSQSGQRASQTAPPAPARTSPGNTPPPSSSDAASPAPAMETPVDPVPWSRVEVITPSRYRSLARSDSALLARSARGCACRIEGSIEVRSEQPLARRRTVVVVLNGEVALRDTVDLFMGSPRPFAFRNLPCGRYSLDVQIPGSTRFRLVTPRAMRTVSCSQGELRQIRLVLEPR